MQQIISLQKLFGLKDRKFSLEIFIVLLLLSLEATQIHERNKYIDLHGNIYVNFCFYKKTVLYRRFEP